MKHHDAATDQREVEDSSDAVSTLEAKLEQTAAERLGVRLSEVWSENHHPPGQHDIACRQRVWQRQDLVLDGYRCSR